MRRALLFSTLVFCFSAGGAAQSSKPASLRKTSPPPATPAATSPAAEEAARVNFAKLPLSFEENQGQTDARVKYVSRGAGYNLFLTPDEAVIALRGGRLNSGNSSKRAQQGAALWLKMVGANSSAQLSATDLLPGKINYYVGNDPSRWRTGVRQFGRVTYRGIYPGVDLTYYGNQQQLESDFVAAPGSNPRRIEFEIDGALETRLDARGDLVLMTAAGNLEMLRPGIYQVINGVRHDVPGRYVLRAENRIGFEIGKYDEHQNLVIDPTLVYSTFLGGSGTGGDEALAIAISGSGQAVVTGNSTSADFPGSTPGGPVVVDLESFAFVTEFDSTGSSAGNPLVYSTILTGTTGTSFSDVSSTGYGVGMDSSGKAYVAGITDAVDFPTVNPFQATYGDAEQTAFVAGLATDGTLLYSTFLGGRNPTDTTELKGLFADAGGNAYVIGDTTSPHFPTVNPLLATLVGSQNLVVAKFNNQGQPVYSTYFGGTGTDFGNAITADSTGNAYFTGYTSSFDYPVQASPFQGTLVGSNNVFVTKLSFSGSALTLANSTYLGGSGSDIGYGIAVDTVNPPNVYVTGSTTSSAAGGGTPFPTQSPIFATNQGTTNAFVTKLAPNFSAPLVFSTYLGGSSSDIAYGIAIDTATKPNMFVTGSTTSTNFPTATPLQPALGSKTATNAFVTEIKGDGSALAYSTYLGGTSIDQANGIAVDSADNAYIAGTASSANFPVFSGGAAGTKPFEDQLHNSTGNGFVAKLGPTASSTLNFFPLTFDFHTVGVGQTSTAETVTLTNNTGSAVTIASGGITIGGANAGDFAQTNNCPVSPSTLAAGAFCTLTVTFTPMDQDGRTAQINVASSVPSSASAATMTLNGNGGVPEINISTTSITFFPNPDPLNFQTGASVIVTNTGGGPLLVGAAQIQATTPANAAPFAVVTNESSCLSAAVAPGASCSIEVSFTPTAAGTFNATLIISDNVAGSPQSVSMTGVGAQQVLVSPTSIELGPQVVNSTSTNNENEVVLINGSGASINLTITPGTSASQGDFHIDNFGSGACVNGPMAPGAECELLIYFQPTAASATDGRTGSYTFAWTGGLTGSQLVTLMGTGVTGISLYTNSITAPNEYVGVTEGSSGLEYLYNGTPNPINVSIAINGNNPGDFTATLDSSCAPNGVVPANTYCDVELAFTPSALGLRTATVVFTYSGMSSGQLMLSASGTGIPGPVQFPGGYNFGSEIQNTTSPKQVFEFRNVSSIPVNIMTIANPPNSDFNVTSDTCVEGTLAAGGSCFVTITFTPKTTALETTTFVITDSFGANAGADPGSPHTLSLSGTGEPSLVTISVTNGGATTLDFGNVPLSPSPVPQAAIFLTNAGNSPTTISWTGGSPVLTNTGTNFSLITTGTGKYLTTCTNGKVVLPQGGNCVIGVTFDPLSNGEQTNTVIFTDSATGTTHTVTIQGDGVLQGQVQLSPTSIGFGNQVAGTTTNPVKVLTINNIGSGPMTITAANITGTNASDFAIAPTGTTCLVSGVGATIPANGSCVFNLTFTAPSTADFYFASLSFQTSLGNGVTVSNSPELSGTSVPSVFALSPAGPINFGAVAVGNSVTNSYELTSYNPGTITFPATNSILVPAAGYTLPFNECTSASFPSGLPSGSTCFFELTFTPANSTTNYNGNLQVAFTGGSVTSPFTVTTITGSGSTAVVANPSSVAFGSFPIGSQAGQSVTIENGSASTATVTGVTITPPSQTVFAIQSDSCLSFPTLSASGGNCSISLTFQASTFGPYSGQLNVTYQVSGVTQPTLQIPLSATATGPTAILINPPAATPTLTFPNQTVNSQSQAINVVISNTGNDYLYFSGFQVTGNDFAYGPFPDFGFGGCGSMSLAPGTSCAIPVTFTPSKTGPLTGSLTINDNAVPSSQKVTFNGTGIAGGVTVSPLNMTFPTTNVGTSITLAAVLTNSGPAVTFTSVGFTGPYSQGTGPNACANGATIPAATGMCDIYIKFTPEGTTNLGGSALVQYTGGSTTVNLSGTAANPVVSVSPMQLNFPTVLEGSSSTMTATLNNGTSSAVTITAAPSVGAPGSNAGDFTPQSAGTCVTSFVVTANGGTCTVIIKFAPLGTGARSATLSIPDTEGTHTVTLNGTGTTPATIVTTGSSSPQSVAVNSAFPTALQALVEDSGSNPLSGVTVTFTAPSSGASGTFTGNVTTAQVTTGSNGIAVAPTFTANNTPGGPYTVTATAGSVGPANFSLTNLAGTPASITLSGTPQSVAIGTAFATMQATVKDSNSLPLSGVTVTFTAPTTGPSGTFSTGGTTATATTNSSGVATAPTFTANGTAGGPYNVGATAAPVGPVNFVFTNLAGAPASVTATAGGGQSATINATFTNDLQATVKDSGGNLLSGVIVTFTAPSTGASGNFVITGNPVTTTATTNSLGVATAPAFKANSTAGPYTINATVTGVANPAQFSLTNNAGPATSIVTKTGTPQSIAVNTAFPTNLQATVTDSGGNPVSGASVTFTAPASGASGTFAAPGTGNTAVVTTNSSGVATAPVFTSNSTIGGYNVNATVSGVGTPAMFSMTNIAGPPASIVTNAGTPQNVAINTAFPTALQAKVTDSGGNPVSGASVTFTAPASGASGTFAAPGTGNTAVVTTNSSGLATAPVFMSNSTAASYTVNATVTGVTTPAAFSLTNNPGPAAAIVTNAGTPQSIAINTAFTTNLQAKVTDNGGNPVTGASVTFTAPASGASGIFAAPGSGNTATVTTNASGLATAPAFTSNSIAASYTVSATVTGATSPAAFSLTNTAGPAKTIVNNAGTPQNVAINTAFPTALQAKVTDSGGNPVSGASVTFTAPASGASGTFAAPGAGNTATVTTNISGVATAPAFTSNSTAGAYTVNATVTGVTAPAAFSLTNNAGPAASIAANAGTPQSVAINTAFATNLQAKVTDSGGNPVSGATVTFTVTAAANGASGTFTGNVTSAQATTNTSGLATAPTFTANSISGGPYTVGATTGTLTAATFSLTNLSAPPAAILATTGSGQSAVISVAFATNLQTTVNDSGGHPIAGASVTFMAPASGASGTFASPGSGNSATVTTNSIGVATAPVYTANGTAGGPYNVTAMAGTVSVNFSMTNLVGPPSTVTASAGTPQNVTIGATYPTALKAIVKDSGGNLLSGVVVTFTAPASGASGAFAAPGTGNTATATTVNGVATAPAFSANTTAGGYTVNATVTGVSTPATFSLTNNPGPPATIITNAGTPQSVAVNTAFATMQVTVKDGSGNGVSGVSVTFTAPASGASGTFAAPGSGNVAVITTNASGVASAPTFTANNTPGGSYTVTAGVSGLTAATFTLTNLAGTPASIVTTSGTPQSVAISTAFAPLTATVKDSNSIPLSGVIVTFTAPTSGPSGTFTGGVTTTTAITNTSGLATAPTFTANSTAGGPYNVGATAGTLAAVSFSLTNLAGAPASVAATAGTPQSIAISTLFPVNLQATVKDSGGNLLSGVIVTFTAPASGASGTFTGNVTTLPVTTNSSGVASAPFTANSTVGAYTVNAAVSGVATPATFSLTNTSGPPSSIVTNAGTPQNVTISTAFATNLQAKVTDSGGNPVSGASVTFTAPASGASGTFAAPGTGNTATVSTNASGLATAPVFTANGTAGGYAVNATVTGVATPAAFSLTNNAGPPATITATTGTPQSVAVTLAFPTALQTTVKDSGGNLISGASVTFTAPASGASGTFAAPGTGNIATVTTNSIGVATAPAFTANATGGAYSVNATVTGVATPAMFALTNTVSPDVTIAKSHTGDFVVGSNDTYSIKLTNNGTGPTTGTIAVTDTLPAGLTFVSGVGTGWSCSAAGQLVTCMNVTVGSLAAKGGTSTITLTVSVGANTISSATSFTVTNSATVSDPGDLVTTDKSSTDAATQIDNAIPTQTAFSPSAGLNAGATSTQMITLTGTGFNSSTLVTIGSNPALTGTANAAGTSLTITVPVADLATAGNLTISVTNPANPNSHNGGGTAPANQTFPLVGVTAMQDSSTSGTIQVNAGTPAMVKIDFTTTPANSPLPSALTVTCQVPMALTGLTCVPSPSTITQGSSSGSSTVTLNGVPMTASHTIPVGGGQRNPYLPWLAALALAALAGSIVTLRMSRGKAWQVRQAPAYAMLLLLAVTAVALVGCTTASAPTPTPTGPASVVVTATAADGAISSVTVPINVSN